MGDPYSISRDIQTPKGMIDDLHAEHFHLMISFWPYFRPGTRTYEEMDKRVTKTKVAGFNPAGQALYDAFNPQARQYYLGADESGAFQNRSRCLVAGYN
jgi:alpha-D-xyloside xylohydrolase